MQRSFCLLFLVSCCLAVPVLSVAQDAKAPHTKAIESQIARLRTLPDAKRADVTKELALEIRRLPAGGVRVKLANSLANLATEGDFGRDTLQEVTTTLAQAVRERPDQADPTNPSSPYSALARLIEYEHMSASLDNPQMAAARAQLEADTRARQQASFSLTDLQGRTWTLNDLRGKVVLVNFWATWCPPCRKEMPDLDALYRRFEKQGFVVLAISDEKAETVNAFLTGRRIAYPILLDPGRKVHQQFRVSGIPKSFVYDRNGKLVAEAIDMRTQNQFLEMLGRAGLK